MEISLHRFVRLLRLRGLRVSVAEAADAMRCAAQPGVLTSREQLRDALRVALVKNRADEEAFDEVFDAFFALRPVFDSSGAHDHDHTHDDLEDTGRLDSFTASEEPSDTPQQGHSHDKPKDIRDLFDPEDMATQYNLHQEANKIDMSSLTEEIVFSKDQAGNGQQGGADVQIETDRLHNAGSPGQLAPHTGHRVDTDLTIAEQRLLLDWLDQEDQGGEDSKPGAANLTGVLESLPEMLRSHLRELAQQGATEASEVAGKTTPERVDEHERAMLEESLRRLMHNLRGARTSKQVENPRGRINPARTMRRNMRYDAIPFRPITTTRAEDKPQLVVLADVSLSVRSTARFTLHMVHGLQSLFSQVRTFAFVSDLVEITDLFEQHPMERALSLVFDGLPAGGVLDVDANSDYGHAIRTFLTEYGSALNRRTTVLVLGDGRGNGNNPDIEGFAEIARRVKDVIWLTPEPRYSWRLGPCDLPSYAEHCGRVEVVRDLAGLVRASESTVTEVTGR